MFLYTDPWQESCAQIIYQLAKAWKIKIDEQLKKLFLIGILSDTAWLRFLKSSYLFKVMLELYSPKLNWSKLYKELWAIQPHNVFILAKLLKSSKIIKKIKTFIGYLNLPLGKNYSLKSYLLANLQLLAGVDNIVLISKMSQNEFYVSLRSTKINVGQIAKKFGGGGHRLASGFKTKLKPEIIKKKILKELWRES